MAVVILQPSVLHEFIDLVLHLSHHRLRLAKKLDTEALWFCDKAAGSVFIGDVTADRRTLLTISQNAAELIRQ